jgi:hypothetical protein
MRSVGSRHQNAIVGVALTTTLPSAFVAIIVVWHWLGQCWGGDRLGEHVGPVP